MPGTFEEGFSTVERSADNTIKALGRLTSETKRLQRAARLGDLSLLHRATAQMATLFDALQDEVAGARSAWPFADSDEAEYLQNQYSEELTDAAARSGLALYERDGQIVCSPSVVRIQASDRSVRVDRKRVTSLRPSALVAELKANQQRPPRFRAEAFLESIYSAYVWLTGGPRRTSPRQAGLDDSPAVPLESVYSALTLQPGASREYSRTDFARDLYLLDSSNTHTTRSGHRLSLPGSTGTRGGRVFTFVTRDGESVHYVAIRFSQE